MLGKYILKENIGVMTDQARVLDVSSHFPNDVKFIVNN